MKRLKELSRILLKEVSHTYDRKVEAVSGVSMECEDGKLTAILGPSGCGKTTLLRIIAGLIIPTSGKVYFDDDDVTRVPTEKRNVAMVFQFPVVYSNMTVYDNLAIPLKARRIPASEIKQKVKEIAEFLDLTDYLSRNAQKLTPDIKQRTSLGRAIIRDSRVLILDEPLTNIDPRARVELRDKIVHYKIQKKQTIIYVTHDQGEALTLGDKIAIMKDGKLLQYGSLQEVYEMPKTSFVASFIGNPGMNLMECEVTKFDSRIVLKSGDFRFEATQNISRLIEKRNLKEVVLGIRAEHIQLSRKRLEGSLEGECEITEDHGNLNIIVLNTGGKKIRVKTPETYKIGECVYIVFPEDKLRVFTKDGYLIA